MHTLSISLIDVSCTNQNKKASVAPWWKMIKPQQKICSIIWVLTINRVRYKGLNTNKVHLFFTFSSILN